MVRLILLFCLSVVTINVSGQLLQDTKRVVFLKETYAAFYLQNDSSIIRFTPTSGDIDSGDLFLQHYFLMINNKADIPALHPQPHPDFNSYFRQYVGCWIKGKRCIFINASCRKTDYFLLNTYSPKGGGDCYFQTLIDLNAKIVFDFYFNAPR